ncbi:MAG TPA: FG-GAP-like repeat-containing protein [Pirellulales bacterium]|nr:FG-GAP-like repeat-containing protein [Pirellulales bacterium]
MPLENQPNAFVLGDFNGDGKLDMAVAEGQGPGPGGIAVFLGKGDGTFQTPIVDSDVDGLGEIVAADLNHDGKLDLEVINSGHLDVLLGHGDGAFAAPVTYNLSLEVNTLAAGDVNGDGKTDLVLTGLTSDLSYAVETFLGNGDGTLQAPITTTFGQYSGPVGYAFDPDTIALGDFNGDGKLDLVAAAGIDQRVLLSLGNGDGTFQSPVSFATDNIPWVDIVKGTVPGSGTDSVVVGDFNHDGKLDIAAANRDAQTISVLLGNGDGTFQSAVNYQAGGPPNDLTVGDFNGDGNLDLAMTDPVDNIVYVLSGNGHGAFRPPLEAASLNGPRLIAAGDFNNDGLVDLAVTGYVYPTSIATGFMVSTVLLSQAVSSDRTSAEQFIDQVYQQLLARPADTAALVFWNNYLEQGGGRLQMVLGIEASMEYRTLQVESLYRRYLERNADPAGLEACLALLADGATIEEVAANLLGSSEYAGNLLLDGQTLNEAFVELLFQEVLGRPVDDASLNHLTTFLASGLSRTEVALLVLTSPEFRGQLIQSWYRESLGRAVDPSALQNLEQALAGGITDELILAGIMASDEYARQVG